DLDQTSVMTIHAFCSKMLREFSFETGQNFGLEPIEDMEPLISFYVDRFWREHIAVLPLEVLKQLIDAKLKKNDLNDLIKSVLGGKKYYSYKENFQYNIQGYIKNKNESDPQIWIQGLFHTIKCMALQNILPSIKNHLTENNLISFDNIIEKMDQAIHSEGGQAFKEQLRKKFKAVFIDEFQDTDKYQYEIFKTAFINDNPAKHQTVVFLIADGKQMIYAFRKADMATYFRAKNDIGQHEIYSMKENFRSSEKFIDSLNIFFESVNDPFHFEGDSDRLEYEHIYYPKSPKTKGELIGVDAPLTIVRSESEHTALAGMMTHLKELLSADSNIYIPDTLEKDGRRKIKPSDIGILVRTGNQAREIKYLLSTYKIPAVKIDDANILETSEAKNMLQLLIALTDRNPGNIRRALISSFTKHTHESINGIEMDKCSEQFRIYHDHFIKDGVYKSVMSFFKDYGVQHFLLYENHDERGYSNLIQILEILHEAESNKKLSPIDLVSWFKRTIDQKGNGMKIYEERIESDENAVKIITIHKSKGLEYPIVFNPFLDMTVSQKGLAQFRDDNGEYVVMDVETLKTDSGKSALHYKQNEQENRRLIYVALTRAKYACYIYSIKNNKETTSLDPFVTAILNKEDKGSIICIDAETTFSFPNKNFYHFNEQLVLPTPRKYVGVFPKDNWWKMSYTRLSGSHFQYKDKMEPVDHDDELNSFVFNKFPKGAKAGNIIHGILERIDFTAEPDKWENTIKETLRFYRLNDPDSNTRMLSEWIGHLLKAKISINGQLIYLNEIKNEDRINEFEFDFNLLEFQTENLIQIAKDLNVSISPDLGTIKGIMNGKMDMFFRYGHKYYILDWKTNFLGYQLQDYNSAALDIAMTENNYHLQYLIYTLAARLYLSSRIPTYDHNKDFGGVIYLFARGVRADSNFGIFTSTPELSLLDAIDEEIHEKQHMLSQRDRPIQ
ncbi:MAG: UvrD-helicase domain-containing protein, partial [Chitinophagaceae bacterium]